jgi:hypothetical protein
LEGAFKPVAVPGQEMPGGGKYKGNLFVDWGFANKAGQYPFIAQVDDNGVTRNAAYVADEKGDVALVLKSGMTTELGVVTQISSGFSGPGSFGIGLNSQGQVTLTAQIDNGPDVILLLTPRTLPAPGG